jgi:hypothetical protein
MSLDIEGIAARARVVADYPAENATQARILARDDIPALLAAYDALAAENEKKKAALGLCLNALAFEFENAVKREDQIAARQITDAIVAAREAVHGPMFALSAR